ncbi:uncharacterized protein [Onthophagus taurus]|uniref:uncharacterized protein n=1 Tax=Onthophagus taurus TaxID=166361 RepID=UPI0039BDA45A
MAKSMDMKRRFNEEIHKLKLTKGKNTQLFTRDEYYSILTKVQVAKEKLASKTPEEYQGVEGQIKPQNGRNRSPYDAMFGSKPKVGLKSVLPSFDGLPEIVSEEDLETMLNDDDSDKGQNIILDRADDNISTDENLTVVTHSSSVTIEPQPRPEPGQPSADTINDEPQPENQQHTVDTINETLDQTINLLGDHIYSHKIPDHLKNHKVKIVEDKDNILASLDSVRHAEWISELDNFEQDETQRYINRIIDRCLTVDIKIHTQRDQLQEEALHQVNHLIDSLVITLKTDDEQARERCISYMNACASHNLYEITDKKFENALLGCTLDDQKRVKKRLHGLLSYLEKLDVTCEGD